MIVAAVAAMGGMSQPITAPAGESEDIRALAETKISLTEAIGAAELYQGGHAFEASVDDDSFKPEYEVGVVQGGKAFEVRVDGVTGKVIGAREDRD
jgi:uncharacterized membrane protein YkoI